MRPTLPRFLNREPDAAGLDFWTGEIESCGADAQCREVKRINVSAAFFLSIEFQQTGYFVYRLHQAAFDAGERLKFADFLADTREIGSGVVVGQAGRDGLVNELGAGTKTRAEVLRAATEDTDFAAREKNRAFVLMQYFGYLRRNPNDAPDTDFAGYDFWLAKLNQFNGNFISAEMVRAFLNSTEYRNRFGP